MRDIRTDLKERLAAADARRAMLSAEFKQIAAEVEALTRLLEIEEAKVRPARTPLPLASLSDWIIDFTAKKPQPKEEILQAAPLFGYEVGGRTIHATLVNLVRSGRLIEVAPGNVFAANTKTTGQSAKTEPVDSVSH